MEIMILAVNLMGFAIIALTLSYVLSEKLTIALPLTFGVLDMVLYVLAFFRVLKYVDFFFGAVILVGTVFFIIQHPDKKKQIKSFIIEKVLCPSTVIIIIGSILCLVLLHNRFCVHGDDYRAWAIETKYLFLEDGFAPAYRTAAPKYEAYYPGLALIKYWFVHIRGSVWREGMMYVAYWIIYLSCLYPLLDLIKLTKRNVVPIGALFFFLSFTIPSILDYYCYCYSETELILSVLFAFACYNFLRYSTEFNISLIVQNGIIFAEMIMIKSTGLMWAVVAMAFSIFVCKKRRIKEYIFMEIPSLVVMVSWQIFCKISGRSNYYSVEFCGFEDAWLYFKGLVNAIFCPINTSATVYLALSPILYALLVIGMIYMLNKIGIVDEIEKVKLTCFFVFVFLIAVIAILYFAVFVFREPQYFEGVKMIKILARYGEPILLGFFFVLLYIVGLRNSSGGCRTKINIMLFALIALVLLTGDPRGRVWEFFFTSDDSVKANLDYREGIVNDLFAYNAVDAIKAEAGKYGNLSESRMLLLDRDSNPDRRSIVPYEFVPLSTVEAEYDKEDLEEDLEDYLETYHYNIICYDGKREYEKKIINEFASRNNINVIEW